MVARHRFTPAYAGNTIFTEMCRLDEEVHPRIRGEYYLPRRCNSCLFGSPPHTRGIPERGYQPCVYLRFTPAYAGNTVDP